MKTVKNFDEMMKEADEIDYSAAVARMTGQALTEEQEEMCRRFDALYDETHPGR